MSKIKVMAGDVDKGSWEFTGVFNSASMHRPSTREHPWKGETIDLKAQIDSIEQLTEEKVKKLAGTAGWGIAGAALLGPLGAIGGMLIGGNKTEIAFTCHLKDGRKFMATTNSKVWKAIMASRF